MPNVPAQRRPLPHPPLLSQVQGQPDCIQRVSGHTLPPLHTGARTGLQIRAHPGRPRGHGARQPGRRPNGGMRTAGRPRPQLTAPAGTARGGSGGGGARRVVARLSFWPRAMAPAAVYLPSWFPSARRIGRLQLFSPPSVFLCSSASVLLSAHLHVTCALVGFGCCRQATRKTSLHGGKNQAGIENQTKEGQEQGQGQANRQARQAGWQAGRKERAARGGKNEI